MAHLKQKQISDNSCKAIIIDTLLEAVRPLTQEELSREITSLFHILVSAERLSKWNIGSRFAAGCSGSV